jgi:uncharacterized protein YciI
MGVRDDERLEMFVVLLNYKVKIEAVDEYIIPHRLYLDDLYSKGILIASGPQNPRTGGVLLTKNISKDHLWEFLKADPFYTEGIAKYTLIEFDPIKHNPLISSLL